MMTARKPIDDASTGLRAASEAAPAGPAESVAWIELFDLACIPLSVRHLRRLCAKLARAGLARKVGGRWQVHPGANIAGRSAQVWVDSKGQQREPGGTFAQRAFQAGVYVDEDALIEMLGQAVYDRLSPRQRARLARQLEIIRGWYCYVDAAGIRWGRIGRAMETYGRAVERQWGRPVRPNTLRGWLVTLEKSGVTALIDGRGRRRGRKPIDARLFIAFQSMVREGVLKCRAYAEIAARAKAEGRYWPSRRTLQQRMAADTPGCYRIIREGA